jgi:hypothetical protein
MMSLLVYCIALHAIRVRCTSSLSEYRVNMELHGVRAARSRGSASPNDMLVVFAANSLTV